MLKYILSLSLLLISFGAYAQKEDELTKEEKKLANKGNPGLSVGIDIAPFINHIFANERIGVEANARYTINRKWQLAAELGYENVDLDNDKMTYTSDGSFLRAGIDYNVFRVEEIGNNDNILLGFRYGVAVQKHSCPSYTVTEDYWGDITGSLGSTTISSHWAEFVFGLRSEILKNFYMGWSLRFRAIIDVGTEGEGEPYSIPGYGRRDRSANMGYTYTLEYHIPFRKKR